MPSRPPSLGNKPRRVGHGWQHTRTAEERGYGREHRAIRKQVLVEEPLCQICRAKGIVAATTIADHVVPLSRGGRTVRSNYQGLCGPCHKAKTAAEAAAGLTDRG